MTIESATFLNSLNQFFCTCPFSRLDIARIIAENDVEITLSILPLHPSDILNKKN